MKTILAVDFDGTIVDHAYPEIGKPVPLALDYLREFEQHYRLMLWTMRSGVELQDAVNYLTENGVTLWGINSNPEQYTWTTSNKQYAHVYIDDAAFGCPLHRPTGFYRKCVDWSIVGPALIQSSHEQ